MSLFDQVSQGIIEAMKARDKERLEALRNLKKVMLEARAAKGAGTELTDEESLKLVQKLIKQGRDSADIYLREHRKELYDQEMAQVAVLEGYMPRRLTGEELTAALQAIIVRTGASTLRDLGKVMAQASGELAGKAEGKEIAERAKALLSS